MNKSKISQSRVRELLDYDPKTGIFIRKVRTSNRVKVGDIAGCQMANGYWAISLEGKKYYAHHLAWMFMTGEWPQRDIDHRNLIKNDNRWDNIRLATESENSGNTGVRSDNTSGFKGVHPKREKWCSQIRRDGKRITLGSFDTPDQAHDAYRKAAFELFGEFARVA